MIIINNYYTDIHKLVTVERARWYVSEDRHHFWKTLTSNDRPGVLLDEGYTDAEQNLTSFEEQTVPDP